MPEAESNEWTVEWYRTAAGEIPAKTFLARLTGRPKDEALALLEVAQRRGNRMREPKSQAFGGGLFELRGDQVRLFYVFRPDRTILILDGMVKKQDKIPNDVIKRLRGMRQALATADAKAKAKRGP